MKIYNITLWFTTCLFLGSTITFGVLYFQKPTEVIKQVTEVIKQVNECQEKYDLTRIDRAGFLCSQQGGVLTSYDINEYSEDISVSIRCEISKPTTQQSLDKGDGEQYKCQSYFDDDNKLQDCTCGKCK
jgi:hypothetical protein